MRRTSWLLVALLCVACSRHETNTHVVASQVQPTALPTATPTAPLPSPNLTPTLGPVCRIDGNVTPPELLTRVPDPNFPCKGHWAQGIGIFEAVIDESGNVRNVRAFRTPQIKPPCPEFEASYRAALSKWRYKPATRDGKPIAVYLTVRVTLQFAE